MTPNQQTFVRPAPLLVEPVLRNAQDLGEIAAPGLLPLIAAWNAARRPKSVIPQKRDFDILPLLSAELAPHLWMAARSDERGYVYRLTGEEIRARHGRRMKGECIHTLFGPTIGDHLTRRWDRLFERSVIWHSRGTVYHLFDTSYLGERLLLPMFDGQTRCVLGCTLVGASVAAFVSGEEICFSGEVWTHQIVHTEIPISAMATV